MNSNLNLKQTDDEKFVPALIEQLKQSPMNFNVKEIMPSLTALALRVRKGATSILLIIAEIAAEHTWCHNFLESILQELLTLVSDNRVCPLLCDVLEQSSQDLLISASVCDAFIKRQTAIRLVLLSSVQAPHIYHHLVAELLACTSNTENIKGIEALIRLISGSNTSHEAIGLKPGVTIALERLLIDEFRMEESSVTRNLNVLNNLLLLVR